VSVWQTVLVFVVPVVGLYLLITALVMWPRLANRPRYRVGQPWPYEPMWWVASPEGAGLPPVDDRREATGQRGGARGSW
jgi:hypothetical protein